MVLGNKSEKMQAQPILNSLHTYFKHVMSTDEPVCMSAYVFDFLEQPSAFSAQTLQQQAGFVAKEINYLMGLTIHKDAQFSIISHSVGAYVVYSALADDVFPVKNLRNIYNLAAPLSDVPVKFYGNLETLMRKMWQDIDYKRIQQVANINFSGGVRDMNVPIEHANFNIARDASNKQNYTHFFAYETSTVMMKNVNQAIDHNSQLYSRAFLNQLIPVIGQLTTMTKHNAGSRIDKAERLLSIDVESRVYLTSELSPNAADFPSAIKNEPQAAMQVKETLSLPMFNPQTDDLLDTQDAYLVKVTGPLPNLF